MKSLGARLTLWYVLVVMGTVVGALVFGRWLQNKEVFRGIDLLNAAEFEEIRGRVEVDRKILPETEVLERVAAHARIDAALYFFEVRRTDGPIIYRSENMGAGTLPLNPSGITHWTQVCEYLGPVRISQFSEGPLTVQIASPLRSTYRLFHSYFQVCLIVLSVVLVLSIFLGFWLKRLALDPIRRIQRTAARISADNLSERIPVGSGNDEVTDLARLLNQMFDRLENSFFQLWRFAGNASHELKTPLSIISLQSEKLLLEGSLSSAQQEEVQQQLESISRLTAVIEKLLFLAKSEVRAVHLNLKAQNTRELIDAFSEDARVLCDDARVEFVIANNTEIQATFDAALLRQVLLNLLSNARRVTPPGGRITLSSRAEANRWSVSIEDTGPGLPRATLEEVFEPFVRVNPVNVDANAEAAHDGVGLGLAICRSILALHHGEIRAENSETGSGLSVTFEVPCVQPVQRSHHQAWNRRESSPQVRPSEQRRRRYFSASSGGRTKEKR
jgi:signal transduction histidine kinase